MNDQPTSTTTGTASGRLGTLIRSGPPWVTIQATPVPAGSPATATSQVITGAAWPGPPAWNGRERASGTAPTSGSPRRQSYHFRARSGKEGDDGKPSGPRHTGAGHWRRGPTGCPVQRAAGTLGRHRGPVERGL